MLLAVAPDESDRPPAERRGWDNIQINTYEVVDEYLPMADCAEVMAKLRVCGSGGGKEWHQPLNRHAF